ncbi:MAG: O-antigen ligase family protein [Verrucomicrobiales bacterium]|nr:O-antigen ligase family protein [Verrucomicrobiales bacterium]
MKIERLLAGTTILIPAGLLLSPTCAYLLHFFAFVLALSLLFVSSDWRISTCTYFSSWKGVWALVFAFSITFTLPFLFSPYSVWKDLSELKWVLVFLALLMPAAAVFRSAGQRKVLRMCGWLVVGILLFASLIGLVQFLTMLDPIREWTGQQIDDFGRRATGFLRNPIPFGHAMGALFWVSAAGFLVASVGGRYRLAALIAIVCVASFTSVLLSLTRGAWLAIAAVSVFSVFVLQGRPRGYWLRGLGVACLAGILVVAFSSETRARLLSAFDSGDRSNGLRLELWQANYEILKDHPFGVGYNANDLLIGEAFDKLGFERHEWMGHSHNEFVEIGVGSGWLGLALYLWLTAWLLWRSVKIFRGLEMNRDSWASFTLLSSILLQLFVSVCALTDQLSTPGRYLLCLAWAVVIVAPVELASKEVGK